MKQAVVLLVVALATLTLQQGPSEATKKKMQADETACKASEKPSQSDVDLARKKEVPTTQPGKCFVGCMFEKRGILNNGAFSQSAADAQARKDVTNNPTVLAAILKANAACAAEVGITNNKCVTGPKLMQCFNKNMPKPPKK